ncbi:MAG: hypothetical protein VX589_06390 [Myxococcota bacterium]|nr:hypothetical protein [Myxococcota bacterium]
MNDGDYRFYIGAHLSGAMRECLGEYQNALYQTLVKRAFTVRNIQRRLLCMPMLDAGDHSPEAEEILGLCLRRITMSPGAIATQVIGVEFESKDENLHYISLRLGDETGQLTQLRDKLSKLLAGYGFSIRQGVWQPHVPVARVQGPRVDLELPPLPSTPRGRIAKLSLFGHRPANVLKTSGRPIFSFDLTKAVATVEHTTDDEDALNEIREELNQRLAAVTAAFSTSRRRKKPRIDDADPTDADPDNNEDDTDEGED